MKALISLSDKTNLLQMATRLHQHGVELISTGGTQKTIEEANLPVKNISELTHFSEILDGRLKTLHPLVHGGLLGRSRLPTHRQQMAEHQIERIDFLIVNLYPFKETVSQKNNTLEACIEQIDIGGPAMLRSAAKNFEDVIVLCDPADYEPTISLWEQNLLTKTHRKQLAAKAFRHTASYDAIIADYLTDELFPEKITLTFERQQHLRYGENPHQRAAFYVNSYPQKNLYNLTNATQLNGKELSYNNIQDANAALQLLKEFDQTTAVAIKHTNPCGVGKGKNPSDALKNCYDADPISIFGGIVAINTTIDLQTATLLANIFLEIVIAPHFIPEALELLTKKKNLRLLQMSVLEHSNPENKAVNQQSPTFMPIEGGLLVQETDTHQLTQNDCKIMSILQPNQEDFEDILFLWKIVKHTKSNAIVVGKGDKTLGIGAGQQNRIGSALLALTQAGTQTQGATLVSDAFIPMRDTVDLCAKFGIKTIVQTGGSIKDPEVIEAANQHHIVMIFTGIRHFKH